MKSEWDRYQIVPGRYFRYSQLYKKKKKKTVARIAAEVLRSGRPHGHVIASCGQFENDAAFAPRFLTWNSEPHRRERRFATPRTVPRHPRALVYVHLPGGPWELRSRAAAAGTCETASTDDDPWRRASPPPAWNSRNGVLRHWPEQGKRKDSEHGSLNRSVVSDRRTSRLADRERRSHERQHGETGREGSNARNTSATKVEARLIWSASLSRAATAVRREVRAPCSPPPPSRSLSLFLSRSRRRSFSRSPDCGASSAIRIPVDLSRTASHDYFLCRRAEREPPLSFAIL